MWSPGTGDLLTLSHTEGWLWSQGQVSQAECAAKACVLVMYSLLGLLPHKYIRQTTQHTKELETVENLPKGLDYCSFFFLGLLRLH